MSWRSCYHRHAGFDRVKVTYTVDGDRYETVYDVSFGICATEKVDADGPCGPV